LEFLKDSFFSVLSSTISSLCRLKSQKELTEYDIRGLFAARSIVSMCPNQKFIEKIDFFKCFRK